MQQIVHIKKIISFKGDETIKNLRLKQELQIGLRETQTAHFGIGDYVILDFGAEMCGGIRILTYRGAQGGRVRIRFGESLTECCAELGQCNYVESERPVPSEKAVKQNANNDHALRDFYVALPNLSDQQFGNTGYRFVRLDFEGEFLIKTIVGNNQILRKKVKWNYGGDDVEIKKIFQVAKRTIDLCSSSGYIWDGVKRDRLVWIGDLYPEVIALLDLYGDIPEIERSLDFVRNQTPLPNWMCNMTTYSLWWMIIVAEYVERTGKENYAKANVGYLQELITIFSSGVSEDGELSFPCYFIDWPHSGELDEQDGFRAISVMAFRKAIQLLENLGENSDFAKQVLNRLLKKEIKPRSKVVVALKYFAVGINKQEKEILFSDGAKGMSTFMSYFVLKAISAFSKEYAVKLMKEYYGGMLQKGATTFWEDFDMEWAKNSSRIDRFPKKTEKDIHGDFGQFCYIGFRHSLCHGWSAGVISFIKEEL